MRRVGSAHQAAKIDEATVTRMREARSKGHTIDEIRKEYAPHVSYSTVEKILYRVSWKHVE